MSLDKKSSIFIKDQELHRNRKCLIKKIGIIDLGFNIFFNNGPETTALIDDLPF